MFETAKVDFISANSQVTILEGRPKVGGRVRTFRESFSDGLHAEGKLCPYCTSRQCSPLR